MRTRKEGTEHKLPGATWNARDGSPPTLSIPGFLPGLRSHISEGRTGPILTVYPHPPPDHRGTQTTEEQASQVHRPVLSPGVSDRTRRSLGAHRKHVFGEAARCSGRTHTPESDTQLCHLQV